MEQPNYYVTFKVFSNITTTMESNSVNFYFYSMTCQLDGKSVDIEKVIADARWEEFSNKHILSNTVVSNQIVIKKLNNDDISRITAKKYLLGLKKNGKVSNKKEGRAVYWWLSSSK